MPLSQFYLKKNHGSKIQKSNPHIHNKHTGNKIPNTHIILNRIPNTHKILEI